MLKILFTYALLLIVYSNSFAQRLHARQPVTLLPKNIVTGDVHIAQYKYHYFAAWKEKHLSNTIKIALFGGDRDTLAAHIGTINTPSKIALSPQLCSTEKVLYLFMDYEV